MVNVFGKKYSKREFLKYFGDVSQLGSAQSVILNYGKATGVKAVFFKTGTGLEFTVLPSRSMDIAQASYKGISLGYISKSGIVNPKYYDDKGLGWLRNFYGGLLTTCGITYMGAPCLDQNVELGLHGRISNTEAEDISIQNKWIGDEMIMSVSGSMRESVLFGENLRMHRTISTCLGSSEFDVITTVENLGFNAEPLMMLFHINFGFPLVSPDSMIVAPVNEVIASDENAAADDGIAKFNVFDEPIHNYDEKVFFIDLKSKQDGETEVLLYNKKLEIGVVEKFNKNECPKFIEWKQMGEGDYVLGLEPGTAITNGRHEVRERGELLFINPGESKEFVINISILDGIDKINKKIKEIKSI